MYPITCSARPASLQSEIFAPDRGKTFLGRLFHSFFNFCPLLPDHSVAASVTIGSFHIFSFQSNAATPQGFLSSTRPLQPRQLSPKLNIYILPSPFYPISIILIFIIGKFNFDLCKYKYCTASTSLTRPGAEQGHGNFVVPTTPAAISSPSTRLWLGETRSGIVYSRPDQSDHSTE